MLLNAALHPGGSDFLPKRSAVEDDEIDIMPMVDCVFLLLTFFMVSGKVSSANNIDLPPADYGAMVDLENAVIVTVDAAPDGAGVIYKGPTVDSATRVTVSDLEEQEQQVANYVEARLHESPTPNSIVVQAAAKLKHREVARVLRAIGRVDTEIEQVHLAVLEKG